MVVLEACLLIGQVCGKAKRKSKIIKCFCQRQVQQRIGFCCFALEIITAEHIYFNIGGYR